MTILDIVKEEMKDPLVKESPNRFMPIQVIWYCEKCKSTMIQVLPNNPPDHCYCEKEKEN